MTTLPGSSSRASPSRSSGSGSSRRNLHKGRACMNCRRRKIKCDGQKPVCGPCSQASLAFRDCEYSDAGMTRTQLLEEQVSILEARIEELEQPENTSSLSLYDPYARRDLLHPSSNLGTQASRSSPVRISSPGRHSTDSSQSHSSTSSNLQELPPGLHQTLIHNFLPHCADLGFFLDIPQFTATALSTSESEINRPSPALMNAAYLWGVHLSRTTELYSYEPVFVSRALQANSQTLSGGHSNRVMHCIQAEVLLANYFFGNARFLEGKYHMSAAVSLVLSAGLHRIRSSLSQQENQLLLSHPIVDVLPPPIDAREEGERIRAFWTVIILNNCWTTADGSPSYITYGAPDARIDTPWPLDISDDSEGSLQDDTLSAFTIQKFLSGLPDDGISISALYAKASILFEQTARLIMRYSPNMEPQESIQFSNLFTNLDNIVRQFIEDLPPAFNPDSQDVAVPLMLTHFLAHVSSIQMHNPFIAQNEASQARVMLSAQSIVDLLNGIDFDQTWFTSPIVGVLLTVPCQVFISEIARLRNERFSMSAAFQSATPPLPSQEELNATACIDRITDVLMHSERCPIYQNQLAKIRQMHSNILQINRVV